MGKKGNYLPMICGSGRIKKENQSLSPSWDYFGEGTQFMESEEP